MLGLTVSYIAFFLFLPAGIAACILSAGVMLKKFSRKAALISFLFCPLFLIPLLSFSTGVFGYMRGTAVIREAGLAGREFFNLDPRLRCYRTTSGCFVDGTEIFTHVPNNIALEMMYSLSGPMRGTYHGPYPGRDEVFEIIRQGKKIPEAEKSDDRFLEKITLPALPEMSPEQPEKLKTVSDFQPLRFAVHNDACVLIGNQMYAELFDRTSGEWFAGYTNPNPCLRPPAAETGNGKQTPENNKR